MSDFANDAAWVPSQSYYIWQSMSKRWQEISHEDYGYHLARIADYEVAGTPETVRLIALDHPLGVAAPAPAAPAP